MSATSFLALDVDVESKSELSTLILALDSWVFPVAVDFRDGVYRATLELRDGAPAPELAIGRFLSFIGSLPAPALSSWLTADRRVFNVGIQAGSEHSTEFVFSPALLRLVADSQAQLMLTIYGLRGAEVELSGD